MTILVSLLLAVGSQAAGPGVPLAPQWEAVEISFEIDYQAANPYTSVEGAVTFSHESGQVIRRPLFWDGGDRFSVRFASTESEGEPT